jgi:uncharacterized Zn-binding protein involved in type VI secretion
MPAVQRVGDQDDGGGVITSGESSVLVNGRPIAVENDPVSPHPPCGQQGGDPHCNAKTQPSISDVKANGKLVITTGANDTCGHTRVGGSPDVNAS